MKEMERKLLAFVLFDMHCTCQGLPQKQVFQSFGRHRNDDDVTSIILCIETLRSGFYFRSLEYLGLD